MIYLSPVWHTLRPEYRDKFGYIFASRGDNGHAIGSAIRAGRPWAMDNGVFTGMFDIDVWRKKLTFWQEYRDTCIAVVCPDVVGDAAATLAQFPRYAAIIREYGYPVAFVTQDGLCMADVPWDDFAVLFVGGTDIHKLNESHAFIAEAKRRGKWVHVGRVNSIKRMMMFESADSVDGTSLAIEPSPRNQRRFLRASLEIQHRKTQGGLFDAVRSGLPVGDCASEFERGVLRAGSNAD